MINVYRKILLLISIIVFSGCGNNLVLAPKGGITINAFPSIWINGTFFENSPS